MVDWLDKIKKQKEQEALKQAEYKKRADDFDRVVISTGLLLLIEEILAEVEAVSDYRFRIRPGKFLYTDTTYDTADVYDYKHFKEKEIGYITIESSGPLEKIDYRISISPEEDGIYLLKYHRPISREEEEVLDVKRKIDLSKITRDDVYEWFQFVSEGSACK